MSVSVFHGSCLCGKVSFELEPPFTFFQNCHCSRCRKNSGSAHATNILVKLSQFRWSHGEDLVKRYVHAEAEYYCTGFCTNCGSNLPWLTRNDLYALVPAGALDDELGELTPERNIFWASRAPWYHEVGSLPTFDEGP